MSKSINPMFVLKTWGEAGSGFALGFIVLMSLRPAIPWQVALLQSLPPLHRPVSIFDLQYLSVNRFLNKLEKTCWTSTDGQGKISLQVGPN